mgnify:CR=1 FL=1
MRLIISESFAPHQAPHGGKRSLRRRPCAGERQTCRASYDVKAGDVLELHLGERVLKAQVLSVTEYDQKEELPASTG